LSSHLIFQDDDGVDCTLNRAGKLVKVSEDPRPVHDPVQFLQNAQKRTSIPTPEPAVAEAVKAVNRSADPSKPIYRLDKDGRLHKLREL